PLAGFTRQGQRALRAEHDLLERIEKVALAHLVLPAPRREQRGLVREVADIGTGEAGYGRRERISDSSVLSGGRKCAEGILCERARRWRTCKAGRPSGPLCRGSVCESSRLIEKCSRIRLQAKTRPSRRGSSAVHRSKRQIALRRRTARMRRIDGGFSSSLST